MISRVLFLMICAALIFPILSTAQEVEYYPCSQPLTGTVGLDNLGCRLINVPLHHANPDGEMIKLPAIRIKSVRATAAPDPVVFITGGPGVSTIRGFRGLFGTEIGDALRQTHDIILIEQRGTLYAEPYLECPEHDQALLDSLGRSLNYEEDMAVRVAAFTACRDRLITEGVDMSAYNSLENARDHALIMEVLGFEEYNLYGLSYGAQLAQHIMRLDGEHIRSVILDSPGGLAQNFTLDQPLSMDRALRKLFESCAADRQCNSSYPNLEATFFETVSYLNKQPVRLAARSSKLNQRDLPVYLTGDRLVYLVFLALYDEWMLPELPYLITQIAGGEYQWVSENMIDELLQSFWNGMHFSTICAEDARFAPEDIPTEGVARDIVRVMAADTQSYLDICVKWDVPSLGDEVDTPLTSDIPTLIFSGEFDPITPPAYGRAIAESLTNARFYEFTARSHVVFFGTPCALLMGTEFWRDPTAPLKDDCTAEEEISFRLR